MWTVYIRRPDGTEQLVGDTYATADEARRAARVARAAVIAVGNSVSATLMTVGVTTIKGGEQC